MPKILGSIGNKYTYKYICDEPSVTKMLDSENLYRKGEN